MKIAVLGNWGYNNHSANGQTIKTENLCSAISKYTSHTVITVKTNNWKRHPINLVQKIRSAFSESEVIIMLPAHAGVRVFGPLLCFLNKIYKKRIYYDVVGGWLPGLLGENKNLLKALRNFNGIWVETGTMKKALEKHGLTNVTVVPNFKELNPLKESELVYPTGIPFRLCTFSRVMKQKGIETVIEAVETVNGTLGYIAFSLDIYGQIQVGEEEWFEKLKNDFPKYIQYKGCVEAEESVETIKNYFALAFPTHFYTEGIPGTIIDAYCAGVPVISAKWESYNDVVDEGITGLGYDFDNEDALNKLLLSIAKEPQKILSLRKNCLDKAAQFVPKQILEKFEFSDGLGGV